MMATSKNVIFTINGIRSAAHTHEVRIAVDMERIKHMVCKACDLSSQLYDEAHYDLAEAWFIYNNYYEYTARVFLLSRTYHHWWNQQLASLEEEFLVKQGQSGLTASQLRDSLFEAIITMNVHPSSELRRQMHEEGISLLRGNPELSKLKIYRHE